MSEFKERPTEGDRGIGGETVGAATARYHPRHYAPHPPPQSDVPPMHSAALKVSHDRIAAEQPDGSSNFTHGDVHAGLPENVTGVRQRRPERKAAGLKAVVSSFHYALSEAG